MSSGIHQYRLFGERGTLQGLALVDLLATLITAVIINEIFDWPRYMIIYWFIFLWCIGIFLHKIFKIQTGLNNVLGIS